MRGILKILLTSLVLVLSVTAQNKFEFDYARFYSPSDSTSYLELYYSFSRPELKTVELEDGNYKQGNLSIKITDNVTSEVIYDNNWQLDVLDDQNSIQTNNLLIGVLDFPLNTSLYTFDIVASDINNKDFEEIHSFEVEIPSYAQGILKVSDIQLASRIIPQSPDPNSLFYKNSMEVIPNPSLIYGDKSPVLFFYTEIYGLEVGEEDYVIEQKLFDSEQQMVHQQLKTVSGQNSSIVELGAIKINEFNSGIYNLVVTAKNYNQNTTSSSAKRVYIYNRDLVTQNTTFSDVNLSPLDSELMIMSEDELNDLWKKANYVASELEKTNWNKMVDVNAKRNFLSDFWEKRDPNLSTAINEAKRAYYDRINYANKHFGNLSTKHGWKTDRGRVYAQYGVPSEIERFQNEYYSEPYEIWHYRDLEGGVIFLFADEQGLNIYRLVHSSKKGEISNFREYQKYVQ